MAVKPILGMVPPDPASLAPSDLRAMLKLGRHMRGLGGERFHAGDRDLVAVVPPTFDSPTTRGLFDTRTGVYWAADSFATVVTHEVTSIGELDPGFFRQAFLDTNRMVSPWHQWMDPAKYVRHLADVQAIGATAVASGHAPTYRDGEVDSAFRLLQELPYLPAVEWPAQSDLDAMLAALAPPALNEAA